MQSDAAGEEGQPGYDLHGAELAAELSGGSDGGKYAKPMIRPGCQQRSKAHSHQELRVSFHIHFLYNFRKRHLVCLQHCLTYTIPLGSVRCRRKGGMKPAHLWQVHFASPNSVCPPSRWSFTHSVDSKQQQGGVRQVGGMLRDVPLGRYCS